jgi:transposase-like protein
MRKSAPSEKISKRIRDLLEQGIWGNQDISSELLRLAMSRVIQELLEQEQEDFLGRGRYVRSEQSGRGLRNGYEPGRIETAEGEVPVAVPQVRQSVQTFRSRLLEFLKGHTEVLQRLAVEMYARGLSDRDIEETLVDTTGRPLLSRSAVSEVTQVLWQEYEAFTRRDLSGFEVEHLFVDALYESLRQQAGVKEGILCVWGILHDGRKVLLHLALGNKESYADWLEFLRGMVRRGLRPPITLTSDGAPGLLKAADQVFFRSLQIRCWVHKMRNIVNKLPKEAVAEVKAHVVNIRDAATYELGEHRARQVIAQYERLYPSAMRCLAEDLEASLNHLKLPVRLRRAVRTTNLIERSFEEERRRTKVIPRFFDERSCLKLVFATLWRTSQRWQRIRITLQEQQALDRLREELGLQVKKSKAPLRPRQTPVPQGAFYRRKRT